jgi:S1-C subfamily serine protease
MHQQQQSNGMDVDPHPAPSDADFDGDDMRAVSRVPTAAESMEWQATIEKVVKNVVAIHFCQTCSFDTDTAVSSEATGFVVDAEKGYILTNRV